MTEPKDVEIDGLKFQLRPIKPLLALRLDKKLVSLLLPVFKDIKNLDTNFDLGSIFNALSGSLETLSDDDFEKFIVDMFSTTIHLSDTDGVLEVTKDKLDTIFVGKLFSIYKLLWEIMEYIYFVPILLKDHSIKSNIF